MLLPSVQQKSNITSMSPLVHQPSDEVEIPNTNQIMINIQKGYRYVGEGDEGIGTAVLNDYLGKTCCSAANLDAVDAILKMCDLVGAAARVEDPPVSGKLSAALLFLYFSGGRDRTMTWDIHRNENRRC